MKLNECSMCKASYIVCFIGDYWNDHLVWVTALTSISFVTLLLLISVLAEMKIFLNFYLNCLKI